MHYHIVLKIGAVVSAIFGLMMLLAPNQLMALYGSKPLMSSGLYNTTLLGAAFLGVAVMNWAASAATHYDEVRHVILGNLAMTAIGFMAAIVRQLTADDAVPMGWLNVLIYLTFAGLYSALYFGRHAESPSTPRPLHR